MYCVKMKKSDIVLNTLLLLLSIGSVISAPQDVSSTSLGASGAPSLTPSQVPPPTTPSNPGISTTPGGAPTTALPTTQTGTPDSGTSSSSLLSTTTTTTTGPTPKVATPSIKTTPPADGTLSNCSTVPNLQNYCGKFLDIRIQNIYVNRSTVNGILSTIINETIVEDLQQQCTPGNWCLADSYDKMVPGGKQIFYTSPLCRSDVLWKCFEVMAFYRKQCNENMLYYLMSTVGLLCDMETIEMGLISDDCFTKTMEALTVFYADMSRTTAVAVNEKELCDEYNKELTLTYGCAQRSCDIAQRVFLKDFGPWTNITSRAESVVKNCGITMKCSNTQSDLASALDKQQAGEKNRGNAAAAEMESAIAVETAIDEILSDIMQSAPTGYWITTESSDINGGNNMDTDEHYTSLDDQTFIYGMVTVTVIVLVALTLIGIFTFKKINLRRKNYKLGYSQMSEEETRMLRNEYN